MPKKIQKDFYINNIYFFFPFQKKSDLRKSKNNRTLVKGFLYHLYFI